MCHFKASQHPSPSPAPARPAELDRVFFVVLHFLCVRLCMFSAACLCVFACLPLLVLILVPQEPKSLDLSITDPPRLSSPLLSAGIRGSESTGDSKPSRPTGVELSPANPFVCFQLHTGSKWSVSSQPLPGKRCPFLT